MSLCPVRRQMPSFLQIGGNPGPFPQAWTRPHRREAGFSGSKSPCVLCYTDALGQKRKSLWPLWKCSPNTCCVGSHVPHRLGPALSLPSGPVVGSGVGQLGS